VEQIIADRVGCTTKAIYAYWQKQNKKRRPKTSSNELR